MRRRTVPCIIAILIVQAAACFMLTSTAGAYYRPTVVWESTCGTADHGEQGYGVSEGPGGYVVVGWLDILGSTYVVAFDSGGDTLWTRAYSLGGSCGSSIVRTEYDEFAVAGACWEPGSSRTDVCLMKLQADGDTLWTRAYGDTSGEYCNCLLASSYGGYVLAGHKRWGERRQVLVIRTDEDGDTLWTRGFGGPYDENSAKSIAETEQPETGEHDLVLAGYTGSAGSFSDMYLVKMDYAGDTLWTRTYGGAMNDVAQCVIETSDGGLLLAGWTELATGRYDFYLVRTDAGGDTLWTRRYGGIYSDIATCVRETSDGGFIVVGQTASFGLGQEDVYVVRTDASGDSLWTAVYGGAMNDMANSVVVTSGGAYVIAGTTYSFGGGFGDVYVIALDEDLSSVPAAEPPVKRGARLRVSGPNPFREPLRVDYNLAGDSYVNVGVYDLLGREVRGLVGGYRCAGGHSVLWDARDSDGREVSSGIYLIRLDAGGGPATRKVIYIR